ncbi:hypothetical protein ACQPZ2_36660 [Nocardia pseudovaccinii]|uniref:hypothetical protein n=1 Tax=Nocardia pseudovaccinii TaxID=189540 RepID=UPI003D8F85B3
MGPLISLDGTDERATTMQPNEITAILNLPVRDVETYERALELTGELAAVPGAGGKPVQEWLDVGPFLTELPRDSGAPT